MERTYYLENLGCPKNQVDAEVMIASLRDAGWSRMTDPVKAAVIIVNSCGFIQPAKEESITTSLRVREQFPGAKVVMAGCLSQRYGGELAEGMPEIDGFFGNRRPELVAEFLDRVLENPGEVFLPALDSVPGGWTLRSRGELLSFPGSAFVKISEGCDNRCAFCAIPLIRGRLRSRSIDEIVDEIRILIERGIREVNLVAHDLNSFGRDRRGEYREDLVLLLKHISALSGRFWIRLLYLYPETFPAGVLDVVGSDPRFMPYFDLPMQHSSAGILEAMGRAGRREGYLELITRIRSGLPSAVLRSTFLVGYPGETDQDFVDLLEFQREADLDWLGVFAFSAEEGTRAFAQQRSRERVPADVAGERRSLLEHRQTAITERRMDRFVGRQMDVLVEEAVQGEDLVLARGFPHAPEVDGLVVVRSAEPAIGEIASVRIVRRNGIDLEAVVED